MKRILAYITLALLLCLPACGQTAAQNDSVRISLLTCSPGEELYSLFGHTAIRYENFGEGIDVVFNYGLFSFRTPNFALRFALGETDYMLWAEAYEQFAFEYACSNRSVTQQVLDLTPQEKTRLIRLLDENFRPENRTYRYNFFYDNCATRPRDKVKESLEGTLTYPDIRKEGEEATFRSVVHEFTAGHSWAKFGLDLCLGARADLPITQEEMMFAPDYLMKAFAGAKVERNGQPRPLVSATASLVEASPSEASGTWWDVCTPLFCAVALLLLVCIVARREIRRKKGYWIIDFVLFAAAGLAGCILAFLALFSSHPAVDRNFALFVLHPGHLLFLPYIVHCVRKGKKCAYLLANALVLTLFIAFFWLMPQKFDASIVPLALILLIRSAENLIINRKKKA